MEGYQGCPFLVSVTSSQQQLQPVLTPTSTLLEAAEKLKWPMKVDYSAASPEDRKAFETAFYNLVQLQSMGEKIRHHAEGQETRKEGLYPIQALVQAIALRFKFHFEDISEHTEKLRTRIMNLEDTFSMTSGLLIYYLH